MNKETKLNNMFVSYCTGEGIIVNKPMRKLFYKLQTKIDKLEEENNKLIERAGKIVESHLKATDIQLNIYDKLKQQLKEANEVIEFYGDENNYADLYIGYYGLLLESDIDTCGKKAREYQKKYLKEN